MKSRSPCAHTLYRYIVHDSRLYSMHMASLFSKSLRPRVTLLISTVLAALAARRGVSFSSLTVVSERKQLVFENASQYFPWCYLYLLTSLLKTRLHPGWSCCYQSRIDQPHGRSTHAGHDTASRPLHVPLPIVPFDFYCALCHFVSLGRFPMCR